MNKIFFSLLLFICCSCATASLHQNAQKLITTCSCENCNLVQVKLPRFLLGQYPAEHGHKDYLENCSLNKANLSYANLNGLKLIGAGRSYALNINLNQAKLVGVQLKNSEFFRVNCNQADFSRANLTGASLINSNFNKANFHRATLKYVTTLYKRINIGSDMTQANFSYANLSYAQLDAALDQANFTHANLYHATLDPAVVEVQGGSTTGFANVNFSHANLTDASLYETVNSVVPFDKTNFTYANLKGAKFFRGYRLATLQPGDITAGIFCHTIMPSGKVNNRDCKKNIHQKTT